MTEICEDDICDDVLDSLPEISGAAAIRLRCSILRATSPLIRELIDAEKALRRCFQYATGEIELAPEEIEPQDLLKRLEDSIIEITRPFLMPDRILGAQHEIGSPPDSPAPVNGVLVDASQFQYTCTAERIAPSCPGCIHCS